MSRPTKEERDRQAAESAWQTTCRRNAEDALRYAIGKAACPNIGNGPDNGGHVVGVLGPDGRRRLFYVRLTEVRA